MDKVLISKKNAHMGGIPVPESDWYKKLSEKPNILKGFENGVYEPVFIDFLFADKEFEPFHSNEPEKNGQKYKLTAESLKKAVDEGLFDGIPIYLNDIEKGDHGHGQKSRRVVGFSHGAITVEDDERGSMVQIIGGILSNEIPEEFNHIKEKKGQIGASAEFGVVGSAENGDIVEISEIRPKGALILNKDLAAFKETALYCSDSSAEGETARNQKQKDSSVQSDKKNQIKQGGKRKMPDFCENCAPLVAKAVEEAKGKAISETQARIREQQESDKKLETLNAANASEKERADKLAEQVKDLELKISDMEKKEKETLLLAEVDKTFEQRKGSYPEDKHADVKRILFKIQNGQATPEEVLALADWKISVTAKDNRGDTQLNLASAGSTDMGKTKTGWKSDTEIDRVLGLDKLYGYGHGKGG